MATLMGLDPGYTTMTPAGRPISLTDDGALIRELMTAS
jgi:hypothetical protein